MTGGGYPEVVPTYTSPPVEGKPLAIQPVRQKHSMISLGELLFRPRPPATPTPIPTFGPSPTPGSGEPTPSNEECAKTALIFLVDASYSMTEIGANNTSKLSNLKGAVAQFTQTLPDSAIFGLYTFSSPVSGDPQQRIPIESAAQARTQIVSALNQIDPPRNAATHMRDGFAFVQQRLTQAQQVNPDYTFKLVFVSDGVPENQDRCEAQYTLTGTCVSGNNGRNYDKRHDPTETGGINIPQQIKDANIDIYSVVISNTTDTQVFPELQSLMQRISSGSDYYTNSIGGGNLPAIYEQIKNSACG